MTKNEIKLPDTLSGLIRVALVDLCKCEKDDKYDIFMEDWHTPQDSGICEVCLAGAVMAQTLDIPIENESFPSEFGFQIQQGLHALNSIKRGHVSDIIMSLNPENRNPTKVYNRDIVEYENDSELFHKQMNQLADDLEKAGM